jgi:hypothetical protein
MAWTDLGEWIMSIAIEIPSTANNVRLVGTNAVYETARTICTGLYNTSAIVGQFKPSFYGLFRSFLSFNTAVVPVGAKIVKVNLRTACSSDSSMTDFDVEIVEQNWQANDPITTSNRNDVYNDCIGTAPSFLWKNTSGMSINTAYVGADMTPNYVNLTGITYYSIRSKNDKDSVTPVGDEYITLTVYNNAVEALRPALLIEYALPKMFFFGLKNRRSANKG